MHCLELGESFPTSIYLQNSASIQPRTSPVKFARSSNAAAKLQLDADGGGSGGGAGIGEAALLLSVLITVP